VSATAIASALSFMAISLWASYHAIYFGSIDPHNLRSTPKPWAALAKSAAVLPAILIVLLDLPVSKEATNFWVMVALALVVGPALAPPQRERQDEQPDALMRRVHSIQETISGSLFLKLVSLAIGLSLTWVIGHWWFVAFLLFGAALSLGKAGVMRALILAPEGEFAAATQVERMREQLRWERAAMKGVLGYAVAGVGLGWLFFLHADLSPNNWNGFWGVLVGALLSNLEVG
jgi:hypothetical protein